MIKGLNPNDRVQIGITNFIEHLISVESVFFRCGGRGIEEITIFK